MKTIRKIISYVPPGFYIVTLVYVIVIILMLPLHEQAYEDDFAYYQTVRHFVATSHLKISEWTNASLIFQTIWGSIFIRLFGLSFKTLHLSTVIIFYFGIVFFYFTLKQLFLNEQKSILFSLILLAFPQLLRFTFSFMSDIPYLSILLIGIYLSIKAIKSNHIHWYFLASLIGIFSFLNRQIGIVLPISLLIFLIIKSISEKKLFIFQLLAAFIPLVIVSTSYSIWLSQDGNKTNPQILYIDENIKYIKDYWLPRGLYMMRPTSELYDELVLRASRYIVFIFGFLTPIFLLFSIPNILTIFKKIKKNKMNFFIGVILAAFLYWRIFVRQIISPNYDQIFPDFLLASYREQFSWVDWRFFWRIILVITFPLFSYILGEWLRTLHEIFFQFKFKMKNMIIFVLYVLLTTVVSVRFLIAGVQLHTIAFLYDSFFIFFCLGIFILMGIQLGFFKYINSFRNKNNQYVFFLNTLFALHFLVTLLAHFFWQEYVLSLVPIVILIVAPILTKYKFAVKTSASVIAILLLIVVSSTKKNYDLNGGRWEAAIAAVEENHIDPREVGINHFAWIPFFFYERSFQKRLKEVGGDKSKVREIHTWGGGDPEFAYRPTKANIVECGVNIGKDWRLVKRVYAKSLFSDYHYCVYLKKENVSK